MSQFQSNEETPNVTPSTPSTPPAVTPQATPDMNQALPPTDASVYTGQGQTPAPPPVPQSGLEVSEQFSQPAMVQNPDSTGNLELDAAIGIAGPTDPYAEQREQKQEIESVDRSVIDTKNQESAKLVNGLKVGSEKEYAELGDMYEEQVGESQRNQKINLDSQREEEFKNSPQGAKWVEYLEAVRNKPVDAMDLVSDGRNISTLQYYETLKKYQEALKKFIGEQITPKEVPGFEDKARQEWYERRGFHVPEATDEEGNPLSTKVLQRKALVYGQDFTADKFGKKLGEAEETDLEKQFNQRKQNQINDLLGVRKEFGETTGVIAEGSFLQSVLPQDSSLLRDREAMQFYTEAEFKELYETAASVRHFEEQVKTRFLRDQSLRERGRVLTDRKRKEKIRKGQYVPPTRTNFLNNTDLKEFETASYAERVFMAGQHTIESISSYAKWTAMGVGSTLGIVDENDFANYNNYIFNADATKKATLKDSVLGVETDAHGKYHQFWDGFAHIAGVIAVDVGTTLLTGGLVKGAQMGRLGGMSLGGGVVELEILPNIQRLAKEVGQASRSSLAYMSKPFLGKTQSTSIADLLTRTGGIIPNAIVSPKGFNTFIPRFYIDSASSTLALQSERARSEGRELTSYDWWKAGSAGAYSALTAYTVSHLLPIAAGKVTKSSLDKAMKAGTFKGVAKSIPVAIGRTFNRALVSGTGGGASFTMFEVMHDAYQLATDKDERRRIIDGLFGSEMMERYLSSFATGFLLKAPALSGNAVNDFRRFNQEVKGYKKGKKEQRSGVAEQRDREAVLTVEAYRELPKEKQEEYLDKMSAAYLEGRMDAVNEEVSAVRNGEINIKLTDSQLFEVMAFGDRQGGLAALYTETVEGREIPFRHTVDAVDSQGNPLQLRPAIRAGVKDGKFGITTAMARAELQRRGYNQGIDMVKTKRGSWMNLYRTRKQFESEQKFKQDVADALIPKGEKPNRSEVKATRELISVEDIRYEDIAKTTAEKFLTLPVERARAVYERAVSIALAHAQQVGAMPLIEKMTRESDRVSKSSDKKFKTNLRRALLKSPVLTRSLSEAMYELGEASSTSPYKKSRLGRGIGNFISSNTRHASYIARRVRQGKNTKESPIISRRDLDAMVGRKEAKRLEELGLNTKEIRYRLGNAIYHEVQNRVTQKDSWRARRLQTEERLEVVPEGSIPGVESQFVEGTGRPEVVSGRQQEGPALPRGKTVRQISEPSKEKGGLEIDVAQDFDGRPIRHDAEKTRNNVNRMIEGTGYEKEETQEYQSPRELPGEKGSDVVKTSLEQNPAKEPLGETRKDPNIPAEEHQRYADFVFLDEQASISERIANSVGEHGKLITDGKPPTRRVTIDQEGQPLTPAQDAIMSNGKNNGVSTVFVENIGILTPEKTTEVTVEGKPIAPVDVKSPRSFSLHPDVLVLPEGMPPRQAMAEQASHVASVNTAIAFKELGVQGPLSIVANAFGSFAAVPPVYRAMKAMGIIKESAEGFVEQGGAIGAVLNGLGSRSENPLISTNVAEARTLGRILESVGPEAVKAIAKANPREMATWALEHAKAYPEVSGSNVRFFNPKVKKALQEIAETGLTSQETFGTAGKAGRAFNEALTAISKMPDKLLQNRNDPKGKVLKDRLSRIKAQEKLQAALEAKGEKKNILDSKEGRLTGEEYRAAVMEAAEANKENTPIFELHDGKKYISENVDAFNTAYPGLKEALPKERAKNKNSDILQFELDGNIFTVHMLKKGKGRVYKAITVEDAAFADMMTNYKSILLDSKEVLLKERVEEMLMDSAESTLETKNRSPIPDGYSQAGKPPVAETGSGGGSGKPPATETAAGGSGGAKSEPSTTETGKQIDTVGSTMHRWIKAIVDPLNNVIMSGNKKAIESAERLLIIDAKTNEQAEAAQAEIIGIFKELRKKENPNLLKGRGRKQDAEPLVKILEEFIDPTNEKAFESHPLIKPLTATEANAVKKMKLMIEENRLEIREEAVKAGRLSYIAQGNMNRMAAKANENFSDKIEVTVMQKGKGKVFEVKDLSDKSVQQISRENFPTWISENYVAPVNEFGKKFSYFPHIFQGDMKARIQVKGLGREVGEISVGIGQKTTSLKESRTTILDNIEKTIENYKDGLNEKDRENVTFEFKIEEINRTTPQEANYLPSRVRRNLQQALVKESNLHRSQVNEIFANGRITSQPMKSSFYSSLLKREKNTQGYNKDAEAVLNLMFSNHYRWQKSKQMQEAIKDLDGKMPNWMAEYLTNTAEYAVFGSKKTNFTEQSAGKLLADRILTPTLRSFKKFQFYRQLYRPAQGIINSTQALQVYPVVGLTGLIKSIKAYNGKEGKEFREKYGEFGGSGKFSDSVNKANGTTLLEATHRVGDKFSRKIGVKASSEARNQDFSKFAMYKYAKEVMKLEEAKALEYGTVYGQFFTQYRYAKANDPVMLRGEMMKFLGQFKRFQIQSLGMGASIASGNVRGLEGKRLGAFSRWALLNTLLGGAKGSILTMSVLGVKSLTEMALDAFSDDPGFTPDRISNAAGLRKWLEEDEQGSLFTEMIMTGILAPLGADGSGTFNLHNFGYGETFAERSFNWLAGPNIGMFSRAYYDLGRKDLNYRSVGTRLAESLINSGGATKSIKSLFELAYFWDEFDKADSPESMPEFFDVPGLGRISTAKYVGGTTNVRKNRTRQEAILNMLGFASSTRDGRKRDIIEWGEAVKQWISTRKSKIANEYRKSGGDYEVLRNLVMEHNKLYSMIPIDFADILSQIRRDSATLAQTPEQQIQNRFSKKIEKLVEGRIGE